MMCNIRTVRAVLAFALVMQSACQRAPEPPAPLPPAPSNTAAPAPATPASPSPSPAAPDASQAAAPADLSSVPSNAPSTAPAVDFPVPRTVAVGKGAEVSFTIAEVATEPRNAESMRLVLLVRMQNRQRQAADFADENFRLVTHDSVIAANGGLGETVGAGNESGLERVQFLVPLSSVPRALQIEFGGEATELPLTWKR